MRPVNAVCCTLLFAALAGGSLLAQEQLGGGETTSEPAPAAAASEGAPDGSTDGSEPAPDSQQASRVGEFYDGLGKESIAAKVEAMFDPAATLDSPFGQYKGRAAIIDYYQEILAEVEELRVEIKEEFVSGEETVALWTMTLKHPKVKGGELLVVEGVSHVRYVGGRVAAQRDYFDLGQVYENTSYVGVVVRWVKKKILGE